MFPLSYTNGNTKVTILADGTKTREWPDGEESFPEYPESMDLKITNYCDAGCKWCHENSTIEGKHANINTLTKLIFNLPRGTELAIGGGDPMSYRISHEPEYLAIETLLAKAQVQGLICNITVNGLHFKRHEAKLKDLVAKGLLHGVGISWSGTVFDWNYDNIVYHVIAGVHPTSVMKKLVNKKVLVLGYKTWGRGADFTSQQVQKKLSEWKTALPILYFGPRLVAFDTLAVIQLKPHKGENFMGEEGSHSMYVDAVENQYSVASYSPFRAPFNNVKDAFNRVRGTYN